MDYFKAENLPVPVFQNISGGFMVTVFGRKEEDVTKDVGKELTGSIAEALNAHKQNPELTIPEIARITKYTQRTVERSLSELKELKVIKRIGGRKKGKWQLGR